MIHEHECHHRLAHHHETRQQTGIVAAAGADFGWSAGSVHRPLGAWQAARRLYRDPARDRLAAADAAEHAAVPVRLRADPLRFADEDVVVRAAARRGDAETRTVLERH